MPARKRQNVQKDESAEALVKAAKAKASSRSVSNQSTSPTVVFLLCFTVLAITSGIYCYHFVDFPQLLEKLQTQVSILTGEETIEVGKSQPNSNGDGKDSSNKAGSKEAKQQSVDGGKATETQQRQKAENTDSKQQDPKHTDSTQKSSRELDDTNFSAGLSAAQLLVKLNKPENAVAKYNDLLLLHPGNAQVLYGKAKALTALAEQQRSNKHLEEGIETYLELLDSPHVTKSLMLTAVKECVDRMQFRGWSAKAAKTLRKVLEIYPEEISMWNDLGVQYLMSAKVEAARKVFKYVLASEPGNGFAKVHLGFIMKTTDLDNEGSIPLLREGIASGENGVIDGRFFFHLGDALFRMGKQTEAYAVYQDGAERAIFRSMWQRSLYNVDTLAARPWWTAKETRYETQLKTLERHWKEIRDEGLAQLDPKTGAFLPEEENLRETGDWKQFTIFQQGRKQEDNCAKAPKTCALVEAIADAAGCKRGQVKFSVMQPGVHVWPHCGPTNCRIRAHLGLVVPDGPRIRVENQTRTWKEGEFIIFDDSFEHEVWHDGTETRLVLIVDFWHPDLTQKQKSQLSPI